MYLIYVDNQVYSTSSNYESAVNKASKYTEEKPNVNIEIRPDQDTMNEFYYGTVSFDPHWKLYDRLDR